MNLATVFLVFLLSTLAVVEGQICHAHIPFAIDISQDLSLEQFSTMKNFVAYEFLSLFPVDIRPNLFATFSSGASVRLPRNETDIQQPVIDATQNNIAESFFIS
uniref:Uncharacterized protein n=1 Tax=Panagrolaimus sp. JU765 TaxID=591449 RepID=A0AC34R9X1_9BILA